MALNLDELNYFVGAISAPIVAIFKNMEPISDRCVSEGQVSDSHRFAGLAVHGTAGSGGRFSDGGLDSGLELGA